MTKSLGTTKSTGNAKVAANDKVAGNDTVAGNGKVAGNNTLSVAGRQWRPVCALGYAKSPALGKSVIFWPAKSDDQKSGKIIVRLGHSEPETFSSKKLIIFLKMTKSPGCAPTPKAAAVAWPWGRHGRWE